MPGPNRVLTAMAALKLVQEDAPTKPPSFSPVALGLARAKLKPPIDRRSVWPLVGAAGLAASAALCLAAAVILGPPPLDSRQVDVDPWVR